MADSEYLVAFITVGDPEEARMISGELVSQKRAACVNIIPQIKSIFRWEGRIEEETESLLVVKTRVELFSDLIDLVKGIHSYDVPEIIALPIVDGNEEYLKWISDETEAK
jgi:periplasmic divalent cation tolerance protein